MLGRHARNVSVLVARKLQDQQSPKLLTMVRPQTHSAYPYHQLEGLLPRPSPLVAPICLQNPTPRTWPWETPFLVDLLARPRAL